MLAAAGLTRVLASLFYGVKPNDTATFATVAAGMLLTALAACCAPAWRAARIDPAQALRIE